MLGYSYSLGYSGSNSSMLVGRRGADGSEERGYWTVWGSLARRTRRQLWRDRLKMVNLEDFERGPLLGIGGFGRVELVSIMEGGVKKSFALKTIKKSTLRHPEDRRHSVTEKELLAEVDSEFIIKLYRTFQTENHLHLLLELCQGGELWGRVQHVGHMDDQGASFYIGCVIEGLDYLHSRGIVYRDLKPENCLLASNGYLKLVDLGLAKRLKARRRTFSLCGTAEYVPPEVILQTGHGPEADLWSLGILIYELVEGRPPFIGATSKETYAYIMKGMAHAEFPDYVSDAARNLILRLCRVNPGERLGAIGIEEVRRHPWFDSLNWPDLRKQRLIPPFIPDIKTCEDTHLFHTEDQELMEKTTKEDEEQTGRSTDSWTGEWGRARTSGYNSGPASSKNSKAGSKVGFIEGWDL